MLGVGYSVRPKRISLLPRLALMTAVRFAKPAHLRDRLPAEPRFHRREGLVGVSDDLSPAHILEAYRNGYYPMCHMGPMKWWSPTERAVLAPAETHVPKNVARMLRTGKFRVTFDQDFAAVMQGCAQPRSGKTPLTWITPKIMAAFSALHEAGHAHSVEVWDAAGQLVGGAYGLAVGEVFFGESQFFLAQHASKAAIAVLHRHLAEWGFALRDAKNITPHLASLGFRTMDRGAFRSLLRVHATRPGRVGRWSVDPGLAAAEAPGRSGRGSGRSGDA